MGEKIRSPPSCRTTQTQSKAPLVPEHRTSLVVPNLSYLSSLSQSAARAQRSTMVASISPKPILKSKQQALQTIDHPQQSLTGRLKEAISSLSPTKKRIVPPRNVKSVYAKNLAAIVSTYLEGDVESSDEMISLHESQTYRDAIDAEDHVQWEAAINEELKAHAKNSTWVIVPKTGKIKEISAKLKFTTKAYN